MACQKYLTCNVIFVLAAICVLLLQASPVPDQEDANAASQREGRFYGTGVAQATAVASANAGATGLGYGGLGYGGYPIIPYGGWGK